MRKMHRIFTRWQGRHVINVARGLIGSSHVRHMQNENVDLLRGESELQYRFLYRMRISNER